MKKIVKLLIIFIFSFIYMNVEALDEEKSIILSTLDKNYDYYNVDDYYDELIIWSENEQNAYEGIKYDANSNTLTLENLNDKDNYLAITVQNMGDLKINLIGKNYLFHPQQNGRDMAGIFASNTNVVINGNNSDLYAITAFEGNGRLTINDLKVHTVAIVANSITLNNVYGDSSLNDFITSNDDPAYVLAESEVGIYLVTLDSNEKNISINNSNLLLYGAQCKKLEIKESVITESKYAESRDGVSFEVFGSALIEDTTLKGTVIMRSEETKLSNIIADDIAISSDSSVEINDVKAKKIGIAQADSENISGDISVINLEADNASIYHNGNTYIKDSKFKGDYISGKEVQIIDSVLTLSGVYAEENIILSGELKIIAPEYIPVFAGGTVTFQGGDIYLESPGESTGVSLIEASKIVINDIDRLYLKYTGEDDLSNPMIFASPILLKEDLLIYLDDLDKPTGKLIKQCVDDDYNIIEECDDSNAIYYIGDSIIFDENGDIITTLSKIISIESPNYRKKEEDNTIIEEIKDVADTLGVVNIIFIIIGFSLVGVGSYIVIKEVRGKKEK